jgi:phage/plasmid-associated DNA primase
MDRGTWRRIRVIPFVSKFVEHDSPELLAKKKNVFIRDNDLDKKLLEWREPFLSLLVHIYESEYLKNGLEPTPIIVKKACEEYKESNDSFAKFENDRIRKVNPLEGDKITFKEIDRSYRKWSTDVANGARKLNQQDLLKRVNDEYGEPADGKYYLDRKVFIDDHEVEAFDNNEEIEPL